MTDITGREYIYGIAQDKNGAPYLFNIGELVRCKECKHQEHCYQTVSHTKIHDDFKEHWSETIEWCSRGDRKGGDSE